MVDQKTEIEGIYKTSEGAVVNKDNIALRAYKDQRSKVRQKESQINRLENDMVSLKNDMQEIKNLLKGLIK